MSSSAALARSRSQSTPSRSKMSSLFNKIRASIYGTVILFTVICLAMAGRFQSVLAASDLTRFVPFAIFVCSASLFIFIILLAFSFFFRERNPISTRIELACLGLAGFFWLVLGIFLATSEAQSADVECMSSEDETVILDPEISSFHTDTYHAMYRVLNAFALMNAALVLFACFSLLYLAIRRHRNGEDHMWHGPVTSCAWFNAYGNSKPSGHKKTLPVLPITTAQMGKPMFTEKPARTRRDQSRQYQSQPYQSRSAYPSNPYPTPGKPSRSGSGTSPRSGSGQPDLENGGMLNPYGNRPQGTR